MTDSRGTRRPQNGFDALFDPRHWAKFEKDITNTLENVFKGINLKKADGLLTATLDVPGVAKEDVKVSFSELDYGFTRLSISTVRGTHESFFKTEFRETVLAEQATAAVELGVLTVTVPLKEDDTRTTFEVKIS